MRAQRANPETCAAPQVGRAVVERALDDRHEQRKRRSINLMQEARRVQRPQALRLVCRRVPQRAQKACHKRLFLWGADYLPDLRRRINAGFLDAHVLVKQHVYQTQHNLLATCAFAVFVHSAHARSAHVACFDMLLTSARHDADYHFIELETPKPRVALTIEKMSHSFAYSACARLERLIRPRSRCSSIISRGLAAYVQAS